MSTITNTPKRLGRAVKARREELKLTLRALASQSGISSSMISDIERGEKSPTISTLSILARALGTPLSVLVDRPEPTTRHIQVVRGSKRRSHIELDDWCAARKLRPRNRREQGTIHVLRCPSAYDRWAVSGACRRHN